MRGLEIRLDDGSWLDVPYVPNTFVLNASAMLSQLSNNTVRAIPHRVINRSGKERYSIPFFFDTNIHAIIDVLKTCITPERPAKYSPIMYGDYLINRLGSNDGYGLGKRPKIVGV